MVSAPTNEPSAHRALTAASSDAELASALMAGDPSAPRLVWHRFLPLVRGMSRRSFDLQTDIDDVVQEVFYRLFYGIGRLREPTAFRAFVVTVTRRTLSSEMRKRRARARLRHAPELQLASAGLEWSDPAANHAYLHLGSLLQRLNERERRAFVLRYVACMDVPEVADTLGVSVPTARRAFSRAQHRIAIWAGRHPFLSSYIDDDASDVLLALGAGEAA